MTNFAHSWPTMLDTIQLFNSSGRAVPTAELLTLENEWLDFMPWIEASDYNVHSYNYHTGLPQTYIKKVNKGVVPSVGSEARAMDPLATLVSLSQIDDENLRQAPDKDVARFRFDRKHILAMGNDHARYMIYGDPSNQSGEVLGAAARLSDPTAGNGDNLLTLGGATGSLDGFSIWLFSVSPETIACPYARGTPGGLDIVDLGRQLVPTSAVTADGQVEQLVAWTTQFNLRHGLAVMDWRHMVRACNGSLADLRTQSGGQALDAPTHMFRVMSRMIDRIPNGGAGTKMFFLANRATLSYIRLHAMDRTVNVLGIESGLNQFGMPRNRPTFQGIPILRSDALTTAETMIAGVTL